MEPMPHTIVKLLKRKGDCGDLCRGQDVANRGVVMKEEEEGLCGAKRGLYSFPNPGIYPENNSPRK
jgi:hypothetical protein